MPSASAIVSDIQRFSLHDGPGIRTTVFFKGCALACAWCQNPETWRPGPELSYDSSRCLGCGDCLRACPAGAQSLPRLRARDCPLYASSGCPSPGACAAACPAGALRLIGREYRAEELCALLLKDVDFFARSGGGVTFSGGEPGLKGAFLSELCPALKEAGVHIVLETSGFFDLGAMTPALASIDLIYFDLKLMDPERHAFFTGADNASILERFRSLASLRAGTGLHAALQARVPVIPGVNDDAENIAATARFIKAQGLSSVHCLPYHRLGTAKVPKLVNPPAISEFAALGPESMAAVAGLFEKEGIHAVVYE